MDPGSIILNTDMFGNLIWGQASGLTAPTDIGFLRMIMDGCGFRIMTGDGRPSIMAVGFTMIIMDGFGYRDMNGRPPGFAGEPAATTMAGRPWDRSSASV
jgi:hypothetical protein